MFVLLRLASFIAFLLFFDFNFELEVIADFCGFSVDLGDLVYHFFTLGELLTTVEIVRGLGQPKGDRDEADQSKTQRNEVVHVGVLSEKPELERDVGHGDAKHQEDVETCLVLDVLWHHLYYIDVGYIVPTSLGDASREKQEVQQVQVVAEIKSDHNADVDANADQENRPAPDDVCSSR